MHTMPKFVAELGTYSICSKVGYRTWFCQMGNIVSACTSSSLILSMIGLSTQMEETCRAGASDTEWIVHSQCMWIGSQTAVS